MRRDDLMELEIKDEFIRLGQAMKLAGLSDDGVQAKLEITQGNVSVNGEQELRRGRKLYPGDIFSFKGQDTVIVAKQFQ